MGVLEGPMRLFNEAAEGKESVRGISFKECLEEHYARKIGRYARMKALKRELGFKQEHPPRWVVVKTFSENIHRDYYVVRYVYHPPKSTLLVHVMRPSDGKRVVYSTEFYALEQLFNREFTIHG